MLVDKRLLVALTMVLDLKEEISCLFVFRELLLEEEQLRVGQVDEESQGDVKQFPVVAVIPQDGEKVAFNNHEVA